MDNASKAHSSLVHHRCIELFTTIRTLTVPGLLIAWVVPLGGCLLMVTPCAKGCCFLAEVAAWLDETFLVLRSNERTLVTSTRLVPLDERMPLTLLVLSQRNQR